MPQQTQRVTYVKIALVSLFGAAALLAAPMLAARVYANPEPYCSATCPKGSCAAYLPNYQTHCMCGCNFSTLEPRCLCEGDPL
jgi:hypothetical protein